MICSSHCIKNPYLVAKIVEVVFIVNLLVQDYPSTATLYDRFMNNEISQTILPAALMKFYTDVETTGSSSEFYDKFTIRYHISVIIKGEWVLWGKLKRKPTSNLINCLFVINLFSF